MITHPFSFSTIRTDTNDHTRHFSQSKQPSPDPSSQFRLAIGSYVEQYSNVVQIIKKLPGATAAAANGGGGGGAGAGAGADSYYNQLYQACEFDHPYPCTKILWSPDTRNMGGKDLLATTGDYLRIWNVTDDGSGRGTLTPKKEALLNNVSNTKQVIDIQSYQRREVQRVF